MFCSACSQQMARDARQCDGCGSVVNEREYALEQRRLTRPLLGRRVAGVCAGLAQYLGWDVTTVRVLTVLATLFGVGSPVLLYIAGWIVMPDSTKVMPMMPAAERHGAGQTDMMA